MGRQLVWVIHPLVEFGEWTLKFQTLFRATAPVVYQMSGICLRLLPLILVVAAHPGDIGRPADLTEATKKVFADNVGKPIVIEGRLGVGKLGYSLRRSPKGEAVMFQVIPQMPAKDFYRYPESWNQYLDQMVRVSGTLMFRPARRAPPDPTRATLPDLYFLEIQNSKIEPVHDDNASKQQKFS